MRVIVLFPKTKFYFLCQPPHLAILNDAENLIGWGIKAQHIAFLRKYLSDSIRGLNC